ncbi:hypothetical protein ACFP8W_00165 [Nocardioides hankookensis]|uniref:Uncharacterized protein n=1 Tax=Nocardioides hankookensis TaxID=443157 RepID=A0ABW1LN24_9ACTN
MSAPASAVGGLSDADRRLLLARRSAVVAALADRFRHVLDGDGVSDTDTRMRQDAASRQGVGGFETHPLVLLQRALDELPRPRVGLSPTDALDPGFSLDAGVAGVTTTPGAASLLEGYRQAAVELTVATHCLQTAADQIWTRSAGAAWPVLGDIAQGLEAVLVLDDRLRRGGVLEAAGVSAIGGAAAEHRHQVYAARLACSNVARLAAAFGTDASAEGAAHREEPLPSRPALARGGAAQPVVVVRSPGELAAAMDRLARMLAPATASSAVSTTQPALSSTMSKVLLEVQLRAYVELGTSTRSGPAVAVGAAIRGLGQARDVGDPRLSPPDPVLVRQTQEVASGLAMLHAAGGPSVLGRQGNAELVAAVHRVSHAFTRRLESELNTAEPSMMQVVDTDGGRRLEPMDKHTGLRGALRRLRESTAPPPHPQPRVDRPARTALAETLAATPTGGEPRIWSTRIHSGGIEL